MATNNSINNTSNPLASTAVTIDPGASGDSYVQFNINTTGEFRIGVDDDDSDTLKISQGSALGTNDTFIMTASGERTLPLQPAFMVYKNANDTNQTGNGAEATVDWEVEEFDQGNDFNLTTNIFTAPVSGRYLFTSFVRVGAISAAMTSGYIRINTSNRDFYATYINPAASREVDANRLHFSISILANMDALDTAVVTITIFNGAGDTATIEGSSVGNGISTFSGYLVA